MADILYVTFNGVLEPLGSSQVVSYVDRLAQRSELRYSILSLEKERDRADGHREEEMERRLRRRGIEWRRTTYVEGLGPMGAIKNVGAMASMAREHRRRRQVDLVHARSYLGALVGWGLRQWAGVPYLFDGRGYWIDERIRQGHWIQWPLVLDGARAMERTLYREAAGAVALTETAAADIRKGRFGPWGDKPLAVVPTCADYERFGQPGAVGPELRSVMRQWRDKEVFGYVGAINQAYYTRESLRLFAAVHRRRRQAHLVCVTRQQRKMNKLLEESGIDEDSVSVVACEHEEMPAVLEAMDWGFVMIEETAARRAMMPTKLAEFFAAGVRPIYFGCNADVGRWVERAGSGVTLGEMTPGQLETAAATIAGRRREERELLLARQRTRAHFGLESGVDALAALTQRLVDGASAVSDVGAEAGNSRVSLDMEGVGGYGSSIQ